MNVNNKRKTTMDASNSPKRVKKECNYGEKCYRLNPAHFREYSHAHLESILDASEGSDYVIPDHLKLQRQMISEQLGVIVERQLNEPRKKNNEESTTTTSSAKTEQQSQGTSKKIEVNKPLEKTTSQNKDVKTEISLSAESEERMRASIDSDKRKSPIQKKETDVEMRSNKNTNSSKGPDYVPIVEPVRKAEEYLKVVRPRGKMAEKHANSAPYHIFYTTITDSKETHSQPNSITFLEILDSSLGELKCSLQINFMVEISWLLAQYYFAGYSQKKLTILYGEECSDMRDINKKKPQVDAHLVKMATPFGKHHTKMMLLCYEDGSMRVVVSTANLYADDWENRTQGLWFSPACPELPPDAMPHDGDSPTQFKKYLLRYLNHYHLPQLTYYTERVKRCDFSHFNVFLVSSAPGGHMDSDWGLTRAGALLRAHCRIPPGENAEWPLVAQASSLGSYGKDPKLWLTGDFLHYFTKVKDQLQILSRPAELKLIYPSLENVRQSHDGLLGGGCLPYSADAHAKQPWLKQFLYQWKASHTSRSRAMPHIKSYTRINKAGNMAAYYLLTSANVSKAAWGQVNKGNGALRVASYEAGVLLLPATVIKEDFFPLSPGSPNRLLIPYDLPPTKYTPDMSPWVQDYLYR